MLFDSFPEDSKVWVYSAERNLSEQEQSLIKPYLEEFIEQWATHGTELTADAGILINNFVVFVVDEKKVKASGCSVDSSVRFIKDLGKNLNIDFFNRLSLLIEKEGEHKRIHFNDLTEYKDWNMFNPLVNDLKGLRENWKIPVSESGFVK